MEKTVKHKELTLVFDEELQEYFISECDKGATEVFIPSVCEGYPVRGIGDYAFEGCTALRHVEFPDYDEEDYIEDRLIKSIGEQAFALCTSLREIEIPHSVHLVGAGAFRGCTSLQRVTHYGAYFGSYAFSGCTALTDISPLNTVNEGLFSGCESLKAAPISDKVKVIDEDAFEHCTSLSSVTVPKATNRIYQLAFRGCSSLDSVVFEEPRGWYVRIRYNGKSYKLDLDDPSKNAERLRTMDFDDGVSSWYREDLG